MASPGQGWTKVYDNSNLFGPFQTPITVRVYKNQATPPGYYYETSHGIKTPEQATPYYPGRHRDSLEDSVIKAIEDLQIYWDQATDAGHEPTPSWLVENDEF